MKYFEQDFIDFFLELEKNNNKDWFDENRKLYEKSIKEPFKRFTEDLIVEISNIDEPLPITAKDSIFRINRDIRFSKDKTPYKINTSAAIAPGGRKDYINPGLYYQLSAHDVWVVGGVWKAEKDMLYKIRSFIADEYKDLRDAMNFPAFKEKYSGEILGDKNKVVPKDLKEAAAKEELIFNKQWYYQAKLPSDIITSDNLFETVIEHYLAAQPVKEFFVEAINS
jgi:uncharacterized protein (TIGR02453 family)